MKKKNFYIIALILLVVGIWHVLVFSSKEKTISGIFQTKPKLGYTWNSTSTTETRYFWQNTKANWTSGIKNPIHNVISSYFADVWEPLPGYIFTDKDKLATMWTPNLDYPKLHAISGLIEGHWNAYPGYTFSTNSDGMSYTVWTPRLYHPSGKMTSGQEEGQWIPCLGYDWVKPMFSTFNSSNRTLRWLPGIKYSDRHVVTSANENQFIPFPGYQFVDSTRSIDVVWKPGLPDPLNSNLVSGDQEGIWINSATLASQESDNTPWFEYLGAAILLNEGGKLTDRIGGDGNKYSNELYKESLINLVKSGVKLINKN
jgi:hypothetical protein